MSQQGADVEVVHNEPRHRFEALVDGQLATADYRLDGDVITFTHTVVPRSERGNGVGHRLAAEALDHARARGLRVVAQCSFIAGYIRRHPQYAPLLLDD